MLKRLGIILILLFSFLHCGGSSSLGGTEAGNPDRLVFGSASSSTASLNTDTNFSLATLDCANLTIIATNTQGQQVTGSFDSSCDFELNLPVSRAYQIRVFQNSAEFAELRFQRGATQLQSSVLRLDSSTTALNLGVLQISGSIATPEFEPYEQLDQDGDGIFDFDDSDDDDDGISDDDETDCDLDGFFDDEDEDDVCEADSSDDGDSEDSDSGSGGPSGQGQVLEVTPRNNQTDVDVERDIEIRFDCTIDEATVDSSTIVVGSDTDEITCSFELENENSRVGCEPQEDFLSSTTYTVTVDGVQCENGNEVEITEWSFTTQ